MNRLDKELLTRGLVSSRSQGENYVKLGVVTVNGKTVTKPGFLVREEDKVQLKSEQYVSRAALKLASISKQFALDFRGKVVLDVGSSTGGFTDYALQHGAQKVIAVDVGTDQLHPSLLGNPKVELHEKTDIREFFPVQKADIAVADVSFISLRHILPAVKRQVTKDALLIMMCKPQFEAGKGQVNKGIIKNSAVRRQILKDFEAWLTQNGFIILDKADSQVAGAKGNIERFYKLKVKV
ncbi:TlyA family RNA methyltransferase [Candidatus Saccharibacteria bacterium]|nr:TlyA family RNA methyltransferase [Candidatus Saccharibacteria bacterium]